MKRHTRWIRRVMAVLAMCTVAVLLGAPVVAHAESGDAFDVAASHLLGDSDGSSGHAVYAYDGTDLTARQVKTLDQRANQMDFWTFIAVLSQDDAANASNGRTYPDALNEALVARGFDNTDTNVVAVVTDGRIDAAVFGDFTQEFASKLADATDEVNAKYGGDTSRLVSKWIDKVDYIMSNGGVVDSSESDDDSDEPSDEPSPTVTKTTTETATATATATVTKTTTPSASATPSVVPSSGASGLGSIVAFGAIAVLVGVLIWMISRFVRQRGQHE